MALPSGYAAVGQSLSPNMIRTRRCAMSLAACHAADMTTYTITARAAHDGYDIAIVGSDGARQTLLGFRTEAEAEAWIEQDKRLNTAEDPFRVPTRRHDRP
jgi:hypothetical protein